MFHYGQEGQIEPDRSNLNFYSHGTPDPKQQNHSPLVHMHQQYPRQPSLNLPLPEVAGPSSQDPSPNKPLQHERAEDVAQSIETDKPAKPPPRASQNRAAFGKWRSKPISGYPLADTALPAGISATEVCESYPNHVDDYVILALMRYGKGAKAIDALIPAQPGKDKADQSHSKIQLRISTIRETFPNENFPIMSTKRHRPKSVAAKDEAMNSREVGDGAAATVSWGSDDAFAEVSNTDPSEIGKTPYQDNWTYSRNVRSSSSMIAGGRGFDLNVGAFSSQDHGGYQGERPPFQRRDPPPHPRASGNPADPAPAFAPSASHASQIQSLYLQIRTEHQMHQQLIFNVHYSSQPLSAPEMAQTVKAHCDANYDAEAHWLQDKAGSTLEKIVMPNGIPENSLSYLRRSITQCFERLSEFRAFLDHSCPSGPKWERFETAISHCLLGRLRHWTRFLQGSLEIRRQIRQHQELHAAETRGVEVARSQHPWDVIASQFHAGQPRRSLHPDPFIPHSLQPSLRSEVSDTSRTSFEPDDLTRHRVGTSILNRPGQIIMNEASWPASGNPPGVNNSASENIVIEKQPQLSAQGSANHSPEQCSSQHQYQLAVHASGAPQMSTAASPPETDDHTMTDAPNPILEERPHEFERYMEEAGKHVNQQARATDLPPVSGKPSAVHQSFFESARTTPTAP
jgi:hypothetical protein